eukprot:1757675-Rhodomonas_salina.2
MPDTDLGYPPRPPLWDVWYWCSPRHQTIPYVMSVLIAAPPRRYSSAVTHNASELFMRNGRVVPTTIPVNRQKEDDDDEEEEDEDWMRRRNAEEERKTEEREGKEEEREGEGEEREALCANCGVRVRDEKGQSRAARAKAHGTLLSGWRLACCSGPPARYPTTRTLSICRVLTPRAATARSHFKCIPPRSWDKVY